MISTLVFLITVLTVCVFLRRKWVTAVGAIVVAALLCIKILLDPGVAARESDGTDTFIRRYKRLWIRKHLRDRDEAFSNNTICYV